MKRSTKRRSGPKVEITALWDFRALASVARRSGFKLHCELTEVRGWQYPAPKKEPASYTAKLGPKKGVEGGPSIDAAAFVEAVNVVAALDGIVVTAATASDKQIVLTFGILGVELRIGPPTRALLPGEITLDTYRMGDTPDVVAFMAAAKNYARAVNDGTAQEPCVDNSWAAVCGRCGAEGRVYSDDTREAACCKRYNCLGTLIAEEPSVISTPAYGLGVEAIVTLPEGSIKDRATGKRKEAIRRAIHAGLDVFVA